MDVIQKEPVLYVYVLIAVLLFLFFIIPAQSEMEIDNKHTKDIEKRVKGIDELMNSQDFNDMILKEIERIRNFESPDPNSSLPEQSSLPSMPYKDEQQSTERGYYLFISSSIPAHTLKNYAHDIDAQRLPVKMVLRGFVDGMKYVKPTVNFIRRILLKDEVCKSKCKTYQVEVEINPELFKKYNIKSVPAIAQDPKSKIIYGDADIEYMLEKLL
jgi:type-F conjugative transfer system pilin assembly protein TrbC